MLRLGNARSQNKIEPARKIKALIHAPKNKELILNNKEIIARLKTGIEAEIEIIDNNYELDKTIVIPLADMTICLLGAIDEGKERERLRMKKLI